VFIIFGLLIGFLAAIPLGPVNVFVISQTMKRDFFHGFLAGITAAVLDTVYCLIAVLGVSSITSLLNRFLTPMKVFAALLLFLFGVRLLIQSKKAEAIRPVNKNGAAFSPRPILAVFALYVSNPTLYLFWLATAGMVTSHNWTHNTFLYALIFAVACGAGGALWYLVLTHYVAKHHHQFSTRTFQRIFLVLGIVLFAFAAYALASIWIEFKIHI
jgi:threonine/homoserine/homoserine lactone efflux protein